MEEGNMKNNHAHVQSKAKWRTQDEGYPVNRLW